MMNFAEDLRKATLTHTPLILDGAMGTLRLASGQNFNPVRAHLDYFRAGAQIITADTVATSSMAKVSLANALHEIKRAVTDAFDARDLFYNEIKGFVSAPPRIIAGSIGPVADGKLTDADLKFIYHNIVEAHKSMGVDVILCETFCDCREAEIALEECRGVAPRIPVILSACISGSTTDADVNNFAKIARHRGALAVGINCVTHLEKICTVLDRMYAASGLPLVYYPSSKETPQQFAEQMLEVVEKLSVAIVGGCCGTTPAHIKTLADCIIRYA